MENEILENGILEKNFGFWELGIFGAWDFGKMGFRENGVLGKRDFGKRAYGENVILGLNL